MTLTTQSLAAGAFLKQFRSNEHFFAKALDGIQEADLWRCPAEHVNPMLWLAGHVADTRAVVLKVMGEDYQLPWADQFRRGSHLGNPTQYPSLLEVKSVMAETSSHINAMLPLIDDERLCRPASGIGIPRAETLLDEISFLAWHDTYHLGQMAYLRKALGFPAIGG